METRRQTRAVGGSVAGPGTRAGATGRRRPRNLTVGGLKSDRGAMIPLMAIVLLVVLMMGFVVGVSARHYRRVAAAQWAADAAAMAAAIEGPDATGPASGPGLAAANGGRLVSISLVEPPPGSEERYASMVVVVEVEFEGVRATAAAARFLLD